MNYSFAGTPTSQSFERFADDLAAALDRRGYERVDDATEADLVLNFIDPNEPKPFRRRSRGTFVAAIHEQPEVPEDILKTNYPLLVRALANIVLCFVADRGRLVHDHGARPLRRRGDRTARRRSPRESSSGSLPSPSRSS